MKQTIEIEVPEDKKDVWKDMVQYILLQIFNSNILYEK